MPFVTNSQLTDNGTTNVTVSYQQVGIILYVTPRIHPDGSVKLVIKPEVSSLSELQRDDLLGRQAIIVNNRSATTTVTVQDGHTVVLGGLITTNDQKVEDKVPFLGDLPLLGPLFKSTHKVKERTELLIILTPTVIRNVAEADAETRGQTQRLNLLRQLKHDTIQKSVFKPLDSIDGGEARDRRAAEIPAAAGPAGLPPEGHESAGPIAVPMKGAAMTRAPGRKSVPGPAGGCRLRVDPQHPYTPPEPVEQADAIELWANPPVAVNWNDEPGPDGVRVSVFLYQYAGQPVTSVLIKGTLEFLMYDGRVDESRTGAPPSPCRRGPTPSRNWPRARSAAPPAGATPPSWPGPTCRKRRGSPWWRAYLSPKGTAFFSRPLVIGVPK